MLVKSGDGCGIRKKKIRFVCFFSEFVMLGDSRLQRKKSVGREKAAGSGTGDRNIARSCPKILFMRKNSRYHLVAFCFKMF